MAEATWKCVFLGESSVGKSSIVTRYLTGQFIRNNATIGAAFTSRKIEIDNDDNDDDSGKKIINLEIWDTAGQERYRSLTSMYYRHTNVAIIVIDVTRSLDHNLLCIRSWFEELNKFIDEDEGSHRLSILIVGNKIDLCEERLTRHEDILKMLVDDDDIDSGLYSTIGHLQPRYVEVSAKNGDGIKNLFERDVVSYIPDDLFTSRDPLAESIPLVEISMSDESSCSC